ncbi:MAG: hypothetical protein K0S58_1842 [Nitrospira sp.]|jgi:hypothetical protein|nr:hypothetical protein [Nitrospira sp.]
MIYIDPLPWTFEACLVTKGDRREQVCGVTRQCRTGAMR